MSAPPCPPACSVFPLALVPSGPLKKERQVSFVTTLDGTWSAEAFRGISKGIPTARLLGD